MPARTTVRRMTMTEMMTVVWLWLSEPPSADMVLLGKVDVVDDVVDDVDEDVAVLDDPVVLLEL